MLKCPYCEDYIARTNSGMSAHIRSIHPDQWKGTVSGSTPDGFDMGVSERAKTMPRGEYKKRGRGVNCPFCSFKSNWPPAMASHLKGNHADKWKGSVEATTGISAKDPRFHKVKHKEMECPFCGHKTSHPPGLAAHIRVSHPEKWKGNLGTTLGGAPSRPWKKEEAERQKEIRKQKRQEAKTTTMDSKLDESMITIPTDPLGHIKFCPECGASIEPYELSKGLMNKLARVKQ